MSLADSRGALPRNVERRARARRNGVDRAAADRTALRRPVGARAARGDERSPGAVGVRHRPRATGRGSSRLPKDAVRARVAPLAARRRRPEHRVRAERRSDRCGANAIGPPRQPAPTGSSTALRDRLPQRSVDPRRPLREQRLAAGAAQADHEAHLGQRGDRQPRDGRSAQGDEQAGLHRRRARPDRERRRRAPLSGTHDSRRGVPGRRPPGRLRDRAPRLRPHARRPCRHRRRVQRQRDPDVRRALVTAPASRSSTPAISIRSPARSITT